MAVAAMDLLSLTQLLSFDPTPALVSLVWCSSTVPSLTQSQGLSWPASPITTLHNIPHPILQQGGTEAMYPTHPLQKKSIKFLSGAPLQLSRENLGQGVQIQNTRGLQSSGPVWVHLSRSSDSWGMPRGALGKLCCRGRGCC
ncbi:rab effector Noc2 [Platysternon megacephalum]|uniref:Rab effector Noc2 n=1 Tax=Platysternon megacephalum TaxID=55544 RepID=A0A4D9F5P6_9SAUR|nr:rab effector Noc2 [Platysternon megacephalum]